ncbi:MAG: nicotinate phosphoribosyltransferase [Spirochaetes bacterium]|nr:nicotinate phosphoribosyltransferase [Spirochaetota bacterium]
MKYNNLALLTDFYELTMMQGYFFKFPDEEGVFEMFFRHQPFNGGYSVFAGLDPLLDAIEKLKFSNDDLRYLESQKIFKKEFIGYLAGFSFRGDIYSVREGTVVFPNEPLVRVTGNLMEAQLIESIVLNFINFQSLIATKTARIADIAGDKPVLEFGLRRAQGIDGGISASRAAYIGGADSTSNSLAGRLFNIPVSGTMAHSWVMSAGSELEAFRKFAEIYPERCILLVDTFNTLKSGIPNAITVFNELKKIKPALMGVRIDSGDLEYLSIEARKMFDEAGLPEVKIFVSSDIDEWIIKQIKSGGAPIDAWGVGTRLITGGNDPALSGVYKIVSQKKGGATRPCIKISNQSEKITNPGVKNVMRFYRGENMLCDLLYLEEEEHALKNKIAKKEPVRFNHPSTDYAGFILRSYDRALPLLARVMKSGRRINASVDISGIKDYRQSEIDSLDKTYRRLLNPHTYKISLSDNLKKLKTRLIKELSENSFKTV